jgi:hypothetical protein
MAVVVVLDPGWEAHLAPHLSRVMDRLADDIADDAGRLAPVGHTGRLSTTIRVHRDGIYTRRIHAHAPYAAYVELRTRPHVIRARRARALRWVAAGGSVHWARKVRHPGTSAQPYLRPAFYMRRVLS